MAASNYSQEDMDAHQAEAYVGDQSTHIAKQDEASWESFCKDVGNANDDIIPNLQAYTAAKKDRFKLRAHFEHALDDCMDNLKNLTQDMLAEGETIFVAQTSRLEDMESDLSSMFKSNHNRRNKCLNLIHEADAKWKKKYSTLTTNILAEVMCGRLKILR